MSAATTFRQALKDLAHDDASLLHPTYRYLERRPRLFGLTFLQWGQLGVCVIAAWALSKALPLPSPYDMSVAVTVAGIPAAGALVAMDAEFDVWAWLAACVRWRRTRAVYAPGSASAAGAGYVDRASSDSPASPQEPAHSIPDTT